MKRFSEEGTKCRRYSVAGFTLVGEGFPITRDEHSLAASVPPPQRSGMLHAFKRYMLCSGKIQVAAVKGK